MDGANKGALVLVSVKERHDACGFQLSDFRRKTTKGFHRLHVIGLCCLLAVFLAAPAVFAADHPGTFGAENGWFWPLALLVFTFFVGVISPISGIGGGVLFVSLTAAFSPFNIDFIRGAGLIMPLTTALSATPRFTRKGLANLKIMAPVVVVTMITSVIGSTTGLWITNTFPNGQHYVTIALGLILFFTFAVMGISRRVEYPNVPRSDARSEKLGLRGSWFEPSLDKVIEYRITHFAVALPAFAVIGFVAGMFGMGAGWANVPALNLIMGAPIKVAASTSMMIITVNDASAAWVYLANGAVLPVIVIPSVVGITAGARIGARIAVRVKPKIVRYVVMAIMLLSGSLDVIKGLGGLGVIPKIL